MKCRRAVIGLLLAAIAADGSACARLPVTTRVMRDDARALVALQREVSPPGYAHPAQISASDLSALLRGLSLREQARLPVRWFADERPPTPVFRSDEVLELAAFLSDALRAAGPDERIAFELRAPGANPRYDRDVTAGWIAVRGGLFHIGIEYFHSQQPATLTSPYDYNYPTPRSAPGSYVLYFEPGRFWVMDGALQRRAVEFRPFLQSVSGGRP